MNGCHGAADDFLDEMLHDFLFAFPNLQEREAKRAVFAHALDLGLGRERDVKALEGNLNADIDNVAPGVIAGDLFQSKSAQAPISGFATAIRQGEQDGRDTR